MAKLISSLWPSILLWRIIYFAFVMVWQENHHLVVTLLHLRVKVCDFIKSLAQIFEIFLWLLSLLIYSFATLATCCEGRKSWACGGRALDKFFWTSSWDFFFYASRHIFVRWFWIIPHDVGHKFFPENLWVKNWFGHVTSQWNEYFALDGLGKGYCRG